MRPAECWLFTVNICTSPDAQGHRLLWCCCPILQMRKLRFEEEDHFPEFAHSGQSPVTPQAVSSQLLKGPPPFGGLESLPCSFTTVRTEKPVLRQGRAKLILPELRPQPAWRLATCRWRISSRLHPRPTPIRIPSPPGLQGHTCDLGHRDTDAQGSCPPVLSVPLADVCKARAVPRGCGCSWEPESHIPPWEVI